MVLIVWVLKVECLGDGGEGYTDVRTSVGPTANDLVSNPLRALDARNVERAWL